VVTADTAGVVWRWGEAGDAGRPVDGLECAQVTLECAQVTALFGGNVAASTGPKPGMLSRIGAFRCSPRRTARRSGHRAERSQRR
jgi:hypothetical protein